MAQTLINFRMDTDLKHSMEAVCRDLGMNMTTAFTIFAKKMSRERRIPFDVSVDPFYSPANIAYLEGIVADMKSGKAKFEEHDLIEVDECSRTFNEMRSRESENPNHSAKISPAVGVTVSTIPIASSIAYRTTVCTYSHAEDTIEHRESR